MNPNTDLSALKSVMSQQGMGTGVLDQVVAGGPTQNAANIPPTVQPQGAPPMAQQPAGMAAQPTAPAGSGLPSNDPEAILILKGLTSRLNTLGKMGR